MLLAWKDKRVITMLSNAANAKTSTVSRVGTGGSQIVIEKPDVILSYTKSMGGVDRADQYAATYCFMRKSLKWWRKLFFWGMEICSINAYITYKVMTLKKNEKPISHLKFVKLLVDQLVGDFREPRGRPSTSLSTDVRLNGKLHVLRKGSKKDCIVCSKRAIKGQRHETPTFCDTCPDKPRMHMGDCFVRYHTLTIYKT